MKIKLLALMAAVFICGQAAVAQLGSGGIKGKIIDSETKETLPFVNVVVEQNGLTVTGGSTDFEGVFFIKPVPPGSYDLKVKYVGYKPVMVTGVIVKSDKITFKDITMSSSVEQLETFEVIEYTVPLIDKDGGPSGTSMTGDDLSKMAVRSAQGIAALAAGVITSDDGNNTQSFRGGRSDANFVYIDGVKVRGGGSLPQSAVQQVDVITGGIPAQYGDATGGIISQTTRNPGRRYSGGIEYFGSGAKIGDNIYGLDPYGFNQLEFSLTGPVFFTKKDSIQPFLSFFISGNANQVQEARPSHIGYWKVKDDVLNGLNQEPLRLSLTGANAIPNADFLRLGDFENVDVRPNAARQGLNLFGKLVFNTGLQSDLIFGGTFNLSDRTLPTSDRANQLFNWSNYGGRTDRTYRVYGKFVQRFGSDNQQDEEKSARALKNMYYQIQADFTQFNRVEQDQTHKDDLFRYGYVGEFRAFNTIDYSDNLSRDSITGQLAYVHETFLDTLIGFTPKGANPEGAMYTQTYYNLFGWEGYDEDGNPIFNKDLADDPTTDVPNDLLRDLLAMSTFGGLRNGDEPLAFSNLWRSPALRYNRYALTDNKQFRFTASGSADLKDHAISIGIEYEQRVNRGFSVAPNGGTNSLWALGRLYSNNHIEGLDRSNPVFDFFEDESGRQGPRVTYPRLNAAPGEYSGDDAQFFFDYNLRNALGLDPDGTDFIDFDAISPDDLKLSYFSADELLNNGAQAVSYYGYDHHGNYITGSSTFDDFFTQRDRHGNFTRPIDAFRPIYMAGYIQDKFAFEDLIFNVGVRVDRYDANQKVLKDPYVLFPTIKAGEADALALADGAHPETIGDDYVVYVDDIRNPTTIRGYRSGNTWFNEEGTEITDPSGIAPGTGIAPLLVDPERTNTADLTSESFEDFKPVNIFMPRIAFSFPISEEAIFTAHYDILTRMPNTNTLNRLDPTDYLFLTSNTSVKNNPNLQPERTIDYEAGFQQVLTKYSSIKLSAFYREVRDQVQLINVTQAYPREYRTYDNIDFGTVKGFTVTYDLRRAKNSNITLRGSYTLQFAEGTGSNTTTALSLINAGKDNLRVTNPLTADQRHTITGNIDYRYGSGKDYNGPVLTIGEKQYQIFANSGANFTFNAGSGTPYSGQSAITGSGLISGGGAAFLEGSINGQRLPWSFRTDLRLDKNFTRKLGDTPDARRINFSVYLQILNLLNNQNIIGVYRATGNPTDDGYLADARFQNDIAAQNDEQTFRELYNLKVSNPFNFNLPRQTRLGLMLNF
jgi:hypothetical protein